MRTSMDRIHGALPCWMQRAFGWLRLTLMPSVGVAAVNLSALVICVGAITGLFLILQPPPIQRVDLLELEPADHVVDRSKNGTLTVVRRLVMSRPANLQVIRVWVDQNGGITPTLDDYIFVGKGENVRTRVRVAPPLALNPGHYRYRVALRWCNPLKCEVWQLEDIEVTILGQSPVDNRNGWQEHRF